MSDEVEMIQILGKTVDTLTRAVEILNNTVQSLNLRVTTLEQNKILDDK